MATGAGHEPATSGFGVRSVELVDPSRPTNESIPRRHLPTDLYLPEGPGPFPLVVHAHGWDGASWKFSRLLGTWASAGYAVAAPNFPRTNAATPEELRDLGDYLNQPADVTFVLDSVLAMSARGGELEGLLDPDRIGLSGLSLGGATAYPLLFNHRHRDPRYRCGLLMSALELPYHDDPYDFSRRIPMLTFAGTADASVPYELQQDTIAKLGGPAWNVTLPGGEHATPYEDPPSAHDPVVAAGTTAFWDLTLRDDSGAAERLLEALNVEGLSFVDVSDPQNHPQNHPRPHPSN
ncbi:MAG: hypothetical protein KDB31_09910 [Microthrixaceae bacterium]|nr:hypothetical protein [Microthrixaceae bacterium]